MLAFGAPAGVLACAGAREANIGDVNVASASAQSATREGRPHRATAPTVGTRAPRAMLTS